MSFARWLTVGILTLSSWGARATDTQDPTLPVDPLAGDEPPAAWADTGLSPGGATREAMHRAGLRLAWVISQADKTFGREDGVEEVKATTCDDRGYYHESMDGRVACLVVITKDRATTERLIKSYGSGKNPSKWKGVYMNIITQHAPEPEDPTDD